MVYRAVVKRHLQAPVEVERVLLFDPRLAHLANAGAHFPRHRGRVADDDLVARGRRLAQGQAQELVDLFEVGRGGLGAGEDQRQRLVGVLLAQQQAQQVQDLLGRAHPAGEHDDAVAQPHEGLQPLLDVRHDDQLVDDRVGRLGGDDPRLGDADIARAALALLGVGDVGALHRPLHRARSAAGADVQRAQPQLVADLLGVQVLVARDRVPAPAHHQVGVPGLERARVAQQAEHRVGDPVRTVQVGAAALAQLDRRPGQVAHGGEQQLGHAADDLAVDEGHRRRIDQVDAHAAVALHHLDVEIRVQVARRARVVAGAATGEHRQRAAAQQLVHATGRGIAQPCHLGPGKDVQPAARVDACVLHGQRARWGIAHGCLVESWKPVGDSTRIGAGAGVGGVAWRGRRGRGPESRRGRGPESRRGRGPDLRFLP